MKELIEIQAKLKVPKDQHNNFGGYNYRSCGDILEKLKPYLDEQQCYVLLTDEVKELGSPYVYETNDTKKGSASSYNGTRIYVEATATLVNSKGESVSVKAYAREELVKSGMDASQITGAASSYARKYALNGLFAIDDTKDADATNTHGKEKEQPKQEQPKQEQQEVDKDKLRATFKPKAEKVLNRIMFKAWQREFKPIIFEPECYAVAEELNKKFPEPNTK